MMLLTDTKKIQQLIQTIFVDVEAIYLFGSLANDSAHETSDVDLAFLAHGKCIISVMEIFKVKQELEIALGKDVDLICLNTASTVFQFQVVTTGVALFIKNEAKVSAYEAMVLSQYQYLNEERKYIIEEIISSGKVYM
jgi:uncharacterized protein